jgi:hypothetical protein
MVFLVEVYTAVRSVAIDAEAAIRKATARRPRAEAAGECDSSPELLSAIFIPTDETAFLIVSGRDELEIRELLGRARIRFDRIVPADAKSLAGTSVESSSTATSEPAG